MAGRFFALSALALTIVLCPAAWMSVAGEEPGSPPSLAGQTSLGEIPTTEPKTAAKAKTSRPYVAPRTPWGDPNLQGNFTNKYEQNTPFERPPEFEGRRVDEVSGAELAAVLAKRQQQVLERPPGVGPYQFRDNLEVTKASQAWLVVDPADGKIPPLTQEALRRMAISDNGLDAVNARRQTRSSFGDGPFDGPEDLSLFDRCITRGVPGSMMPFILGNSYEIVQAPGLVAIRYELIHETRVIPLDGRPHLGKDIHLEMGDARGHWEGDTLVIETTNFTERSAYRNANAERLRLIERFTPTTRGRIEWTVTVDDPTTWTKPWTFAMPLTMNDREPVLEYACHEGNYSLGHILSGARATERETAKARATR
jgi:hypothetical protein